jgi:hypothetical protein
MGQACPVGQSLSVVHWSGTHVPPRHQRYRPSVAQSASVMQATAPPSLPEGMGTFDAEHCGALGRPVGVPARLTPHAPGVASADASGAGVPPSPLVAVDVLPPQQTRLTMKTKREGPRTAHGTMPQR